MNRKYGKFERKTYTLLSVSVTPNGEVPDDDGKELRGTSSNGCPPSTLQRQARIQQPFDSGGVIEFQQSQVQGTITSKVDSAKGAYDYTEPPEGTNDSVESVRKSPRNKFVPHHLHEFLLKRK
jgi:hypothetical protein